MSEPEAAGPNSAFILASIGAKRRLNPTISRSLPVLVTTSLIRSSSSVVSASGFSTNTALPVSSARQTRSAWVACRVTTKIASSDSSSSTAWALVEAVVKPNRRWALTADSDRVVATWARWASGSEASGGSNMDEA